MSTTSIGGYPIDVVKEYKPKLTSKTTDHPVEEGSDLTDSIQAQPFEFTLDCIISNNPVGVIASDPTRTGSSNPAQDAYDAIAAMYAASLPVTVIVFGKTLLNCAITDISPVFNAENNGGLAFTAAFKQLRILSNKRTTVRVAVPNGGGQDHKGDRQAITLDPSSTWVVSFLATTYNRAKYSKVFGAPLVKGTLAESSPGNLIGLPTGTQEDTDNNQKYYDRYKVDPYKTTPDGFVDKGGTYHPYQFDPKDGKYRSPGNFYDNPNNTANGISDYDLANGTNNSSSISTAVSQFSK